MNEKSQKRYTPFILRTGFLHSYWRTVPLLGLVIFLEAILWVMAGFWPPSIEFALMRWGIFLILIFVVPIGTWTIRDIVAGYDDLFEVFDVETEENLKLYRSMDRPPSESQEDIRNLFKNQKIYEAFRDGVRQILFDKKELLWILLTTSLFSIVFSFYSLYPKIIMGAAIFTYPLINLEIFVDIFASFFMNLVISLIFWFGVAYLRTVSRLGASDRNLRIWNYIRYLRGEPINDSSFMTYRKFFDNASTIGRYVYSIAFRIVLLSVFSALSLTLFAPPSPVMLIFAGWSFVFGLLILFLPLNSLHKVMKRAKNAVVKELEKEYDQLTIRFMSQLRRLRQTKTPDDLDKEDKELSANINALRGILLETELQWTWPIRLPMVLRIILTSLIPAIGAILSLLGIL